MKYSCTYLCKVILLHYLLLSPSLINAQKNIEKSEFNLNYDIGKSIFHLILGGYSFDIEGLYRLPNSRFGIGLGLGYTKYFVKKDEINNIKDFTVKGYYFKPQINYIIIKEPTWYLTLSLGGIFSKYDESLKPFIPGGYYAPLVGESLNRSDMNTIGGDMRFSYHFETKSRFSVIITGAMAVVGYPKMPPNEIIDRLEPLYIPGAGIRATEGSFNSGSSVHNDTFISFNVGLKVAYRLFPNKRED